MGKDVILACDFASKEETMTFLDLFQNETRKPYLKIGMELFYAAGPDIVREVKGRGHSVFLDLKLHDIPTTVKRTMTVLSRLEVDMCNVHAAGAITMMEAAMEGMVRPDGTKPLLIAVTQLTSTGEDQRKELCLDRPVAEVVKIYAENARKAGLDGVVCSPLEAESVHASCGLDFLTVTPGVRFAENEQDDQARVTTPTGAKVLGADYIVVGRPITKAEDPVAAYRRCLEEFID